MNVKRRREITKGNRKSLEISRFIGLLAIEGWRRLESNHERREENERIRRSIHGRNYVIGPNLGNAESCLEIRNQRRVNMMNAKEIEALKNIKELLSEYQDERYTPHVTREDLETLVKLVEKNAKK